MQGRMKKQESDCSPGNECCVCERATVGMLGCGGWRKRMEFGCAGVGAGCRGDEVPLVATGHDRRRGEGGRYLIAILDCDRIG